MSADVTCADCKQRLAEDRASRCDLTGEAFCDEHLVACDHQDCERRIWRGAAQKIEGRPVCPQHIYRCHQGHPALAEAQRRCAVSNQLVCPTHAVDCAECDQVMIEDYALVSAASGAWLCPACAERCFECNRPFESTHLEECSLSGKRVCPDHIAECQHGGCAQRIRDGVALVHDDWRGCPEHLARCSVSPRHVALRDRLRDCPGFDGEDDPKGPKVPCEALLCDRPAHRCFRCQRPVCPDHRRTALGERRPRYCPPCLAELPRCSTCSVPMSRSDGRCPLCMKIAEQTYDPDSGPPFGVLRSCKLRFPRYGSWRTCSYEDTRMWERRVWLSTVRVVKVADNPGVYEQRLGLWSAIQAFAKGG